MSSDNLGKSPDNLGKSPDNLGKSSENLGKSSDNLGMFPENLIMFLEDRLMFGEKTFRFVRPAGHEQGEVARRVREEPSHGVQIGGSYRLDPDAGPFPGVVSIAATGES